MVWEKQKLTLNKEHCIFFCLQLSIVVNHHRVVPTVLFLQALDLQSPIPEHRTPALLLVRIVLGVGTFELNQPLTIFVPRYIVAGPRDQWSSDAEKSCLVHRPVNPGGVGACGGKHSQLSPAVTAVTKKVVIVICCAPHLFLSCLSLSALLMPPSSPAQNHFLTVHKINSSIQFHSEKSGSNELYPGWLGVTLDASHSL